MTSSVDTPAPGRLRDLQGLRAVAVLAVMVTHAGLPVPGGFTGVDVFFVISGFIITLMLLREHATTGTISFRRFYIRRLKRLGPALAVTSTVTVLLSLLFLSPLGPQETALKTALGATVGVANWVIADHTGDYFGTAAERNPMLHTWSLSVEEQFYVVLPALLLFSLVLGGRLSRRWPKAVPLLLLGTLALASLASVRMGTNFPLGYYGPVTRAWEFLAGCLLALGIGLVQRLPSLVLRAAGVIGAGLMVWGFMAITPETPFPGKWALLPVVGTALLILAGRDGGGPLTAILSSRPMVAIGDWSYSLYLWHWPFIVVAKAIWPFSAAAPVIAAAAAILPAYVSFRFIEEPFRALRVEGVRRVISTLGVVLIPPTAMAVSASLVFAAAIAPSVERPRDLDEDVEERSSELVPCDPDMADLSNGLCGTTKPGAASVLIIGDSHAEALFPGFVSLYPDANIGIITVRSPKPFASMEGVERVLRHVEARPEIETVVYVRHLVRDGRALSVAEEAGMRRTVEGIAALGRRILVADDSPQWPTDMYSCTHRRSLILGGTVCDWDRSYFEPREVAIREALEDMTGGRELAGIVSMHTALCDGTRCYRDSPEGLLYSDDDHVTELGARLLAERAVETTPVLRAALEDAASR